MIQDVPPPNMAAPDNAVVAPSTHARPDLASQIQKILSDQKRDDERPGADEQSAYVPEPSNGKLKAPAFPGLPLPTPTPTPPARGLFVDPMPEQPAYSNGIPPPAATDIDRRAVSIGAISLVCALAILGSARWRAAIVRTAKERAAFILAVGLAIMAWSLTVAPNGDRFSATLFVRLVSEGWATLLGAVLAIVGAYRWITGGR